MMDVWEPQFYTLSLFLCQIGTKWICTSSLHCTFFSLPIFIATCKQRLPAPLPRPFMWQSNEFPTSPFSICLSFNGQLHSLESSDKEVQIKELPRLYLYMCIHMSACTYASVCTCVYVCVSLCRQWKYEVYCSIRMAHRDAHILVFFSLVLKTASDMSSVCSLLGKCS